MESKSEQINTLIELNDELENYFRNTIIPQLKSLSVCQTL